MRRLGLLVAGLGLLAGAVGCHHTAGACDCVPPGYDAACPIFARPHAVAAPGPAPFAAAPAGEPIRVMPKVVEPPEPPAANSKR